MKVDKSMCFQSLRTINHKFETSVCGAFQGFQRAKAHYVGPDFSRLYYGKINCFDENATNNQLFKFRDKI